MAPALPHPRVRKRWLLWLLVALLLFTGLPVAIAALARTRVVREYAGREAAAALRRELGMRVDIEEVDVDPDHLAVVARNIQLTHPKHGPFVSAASLSIRPSWWALLRGRLDLHAITIDQATVWIKVRDGKVENFPTLPESKKADSQELALPFHWLHVRHARLIVDADPLAQGELQNIHIQINASRPERAQVELRCNSGFVRHAKGTDTLSRLELVAGVSLDAVDVERLRIETPDVQVGLNKAELVLPLGQRYRGQAELRVSLAQLARWPIDVELPPLAGQVEVSGDVAGDRSGARGTAKVVLSRVIIDQYGLGERVDLDLRFDPTGVNASGVAELIRDGGAVALDARVALSEGLPLKVQADVHDVNFAKLMEQLGVSENAIVDWTLAGHFSLAGTLVPLDLSGPLRMPTRDFKILRDAWHAPPPERRIMGVSSAKLAGTVRVRADGIHLQDFDIALPRSRLNATVLLGFDNQLRIQASALDWGLADCSPLLQFGLDGRGAFDLEVTGTFSDPIVKGNMRAADFTFGGFNFGNLQTPFELDQDLMGVHFGRIDATKNKSHYGLEGGYLDFRNDAFKTGGTLEVERLALVDFYKIFHYDGDERYDPYQGSIAGKATLQYTLGYPEDSPNGTLVSEMDVAIAEADLDGYRFTDGHFAGVFRWLDHARGYRGSELEVQRLTLRKGSGSLSVSGRMREEGALDLVVLGDAIAIQDTESLHARMPGLGGTLAVTGNVKGSAAKPRAELEVVASGVTLQGRPLGDGRVYVKLTDKEDPWVAQALAWKTGAPPADASCGRAREGLARGTWPEDPPFKTSEGPQPRLDQPMAWLICGQALQGDITADLMLGRTQAFPIAGRIAWKDLVLDKILPPSRQGPLHARLSGSLTVREGELRNPQTLAGEAELTKLSVGQRDVELNNRGPIGLRFDHGNFQVTSATLAGPSTELAVTGGGSLREGLGLSVDGHVDLGLLSTLSQTISYASGSVALGFKVSGMLDEPSVYGHALVRGAALKIASFPEAINDVTGKVTFSARRVLLEGFSAKIAGGTVSLSGAAELSGIGVGSYTLRIDAESLAIAPRDGIALKLGGNGRLSWKRGDRLPMLSGRLRLDELVYSRPIKMDRTLGELYAPERAAGLGYDPDADTLGIDLEIVQTKPIFIRNNLINAELRLENEKLPFRLVGTDQRFGLRGNMSVRQGTVRFRETDFDIRQGDIQFDDETRIDPRFDVRATSDVRRSNGQNNWHIEMHAYGNRDQFQFALTSEPYLSEDDIALLLTLGMTHSELALLQTSDVTGAAALEALASVTGVESQVQRALPQIDDFHIASTYSERSNRTEPQLVIGKRIADNVQLRASTGIAESRDFSTGVELELDDKTSVQAVYNNQNATTASQIGDVGVDLKWRLEFD